MTTTQNVALSAGELERYSRQIFFFGEDGQKQFKRQRVIVIGAGGLGSPILYYLAAAGVGQLTICDFDAVAPSNLNRQILHDTSRVGMNKALSAVQTLANLNGDVKLTPVQHYLDQDQLRCAMLCHDLLIDASDSVPNKALVSSLAVETKTPTIISTLVGMAGYSFLQLPDSACWQCLFKEPPVFPSGRALPFEFYPSFGAAAGFLGAFVADMAARFLLGHDAPIRNRVFYTSQLLPYKKLMLSARGVKAIVSEHLQSCLREAGRSFPESNRLFDECIVSKSPTCPCRSSSESEQENAESQTRKREAADASV